MSEVGKGDLPLTLVKKAHETDREEYREGKMKENPKGIETDIEIERGKYSYSLRLGLAYLLHNELASFFKR